MIFWKRIIAWSDWHLVWSNRIKLSRLLFKESNRRVLVYTHIYNTLIQKLSDFWWILIIYRKICQFHVWATNRNWSMFVQREIIIFEKDTHIILFLVVEQTWNWYILLLKIKIHQTFYQSSFDKLTYIKTWILYHLNNNYRTFCPISSNFKNDSIYFMFFN